MYAERPRHVIKSIERAVVKSQGQRLRKRHGLLKANLHLAPAQLEEKVDEHRWISE